MSEHTVSAPRSASRDFDRAYDLLTGNKSGHNAHDSLSTTSGTTKRISGAKARAIGERLTGNDRQVLDVLNSVHLATGQQIRQHIWGEGSSAARSARRQLAKLTALRVVSRIDRRPGGVRSGQGGYAYLLDVVGQYLTETPSRRRRPRQPGLAFVDHMSAVAGCYVTVHQLHRCQQLELIHFEGEPGCWREFYGPGGAPRILKPDAFVITASGEWEDRWLLEVDRGTESPSRIRAKADAYVSYWRSGREQADGGVFPKVLFVAPDERRVDQLVRTLSALPADHWRLFQVTTEERFAETLVAGSGSNSGAGASL